ncbi:hypothetical protein GCM10028805_50750 [Spirosoma harenae]
MSRQDFFRLVGISIGTILLTDASTACAGHTTEELSPDKIPTIDFTLQLDAKANENLTVKGGYIVTNNIIVAQTKDGQFIAVAAKCTQDNTLLVFKSASGEFYCPLDLSRFDTTGKIVSGPATTPLTKYVVEANLPAGTVRVHN